MLTSGHAREVESLEPSQGVMTSICQQGGLGERLSLILKPYFSHFCHPCIPKSGILTFTICDTFTKESSESFNWEAPRVRDTDEDVLQKVKLAGKIIIANAFRSQVDKGAEKHASVLDLAKFLLPVFEQALVEVQMTDVVKLGVQEILDTCKAIRMLCLELQPETE
eukprot:6259678-Amphidinium_carterae.1